MTPQAGGIRIALLEDHAATRQALVEELGDFADRVTVVTAVSDAEALFASLRTRPVQVALVDLRLQGTHGNEVIRRLGKLFPDVRALALTAFDDDSTVLEAVRAGAHGYLLKDEPVERLVRSIEEAATGAHPISSRIAGFLLTHTREATTPVLLSEREEQVAIALAEGLTYAECSERLSIAHGTVQDYVKRVYRKLDINSKREVREWVSRHLGGR